MQKTEENNLRVANLMLIFLKGKMMAVKKRKNKDKNKKKGRKLFLFNH